MKRLIGFTVLLLTLIAVRQAGAAEAPRQAPALEACYFTLPDVSADCAASREEAEDYLTKSHQSCASVIYIAWRGPHEEVLCRGYDGSTIIYTSNTSGNLQFTR